MTTPVTSNPTPTYVTSGTATTLAASAAANSPESTLASIANSLMGLTNSSMNQTAANPRMFARMERLVDSLARLIDAFANFRSASKTEPQPTQTETAPQTAETIQTAPADVATAVVTPVTESAPQPVVATPPPVEATPTPPAPVATPIEIGQLLGKTGGFLWKPVSDKDGDLAILLPKQLTGKVKEVRILNPDGTKSIGKGKYSGVGNGNREHFRFNKPGGGYPDRSIVLIKLEDGSTRHVRISDTSRRIER